ncbi:P-type conjugative transfer protein TrbJ [Duganella sp. BJB488]|nr:P-type conjugative transfer protein TrbJ [Duganella sp. BJB489]RFP26550.1 P-type conjugative transfer protein TrbJ [Duganella sp. BJB488]RFP34718.1 P-type conjugative transfer protein TrbJ [Duganella sp. BJB480]
MPCHDLQARQQRSKHWLISKGWLLAIAHLHTSLQSTKVRSESMNKKALLPYLALAISSIASAGSVAGFGGSTEITQILNNVELVNQSAQMYQQVQQTLQQVMMEKQQLQNLIAAPSQTWGQAQQELAALADLVNKTAALSYAGGNIDQLFKTKFPGYAKTAGNTNFGGKFQSLVQTQLDGLNSALQAAGLQSSQFANERMAIQQIQSMSAGSQGALSAVQAGNMIASQQVDQLQKLRQLYMAQMQAQNSFMAGQAQNQADQVDAAQTFMKQGNGTVRAPGSTNFQSF